MLALFIAITMALLLLSWAETMPRETREESAAMPDAAPRKLRLPVLRLPSLRLPALRRRKAVDAPAPEIEPVAPLSQAHKAARVAAAPKVEDNDDVIARVEALLDSPDPEDLPEPATAKAQPAPLPPAAPADLPRITGFTPGDVIALEISGPAPRPDEIGFTACAEGTLVLIEGFAELIIEGVAPEGLSPEILQFRDHAVA